MFAIVSCFYAVKLFTTIVFYHKICPFSSVSATIYKHLANVHTLYTMPLNEQIFSGYPPPTACTLVRNRPLVRTRPCPPIARACLPVRACPTQRKRPVSHRASLFSYLVLWTYPFCFRLLPATIRCAPTYSSFILSGYFFYFTPSICWFIGLLPRFLFFVKVPFVTISHLTVPPLTFFNFSRFGFRCLNTG